MIYESIQVNQTNEFIIFHQVKKSILGNRSGKKLKVYHNLDSLKILKNRTLNSYKSSFKLFKTKQVPLKINILKINKKNILIVDSVGVFNNLPFKADIVILIQSPKINLERLIQNIHPKTIIADGSNYKSYLGAWKKTCVEKEISFHNTAINGAFEYFY
jgi:competence protein ComEC